VVAVPSSGSYFREPKLARSVLGRSVTAALQNLIRPASTIPQFGDGPHTAIGEYTSASFLLKFKKPKAEIAFVRLIKQANSMKPSRINLAVLSTIAGVFIAGSASVQAQTIIYQDNFNVPDGNLGTGDLPTGVNGSLITPQSGGAQQTIVGGQLSLNLGGGATTSEMRFNKVGQTGTGAAPDLFDWSSGTGGADILAAGGFTVSFNWTAGDTTSGNWIFFSVGNGGDISYSNLRILNSTTENGILFKNNGGSQVFNSGTQNGGFSPGAYTPGSVNHFVTLTYTFNSWASGSAVNMTANVDGNNLGSDSFNWNATAGQYFDIGTYGNANNLIDNLTVTTVPEPGTPALVGAGIGLLLVARRGLFHRA
jgi:hypothetical protein